MNTHTFPGAVAGRSAPRRGYHAGRSRIARSVLATAIAAVSACGAPGPDGAAEAPDPDAGDTAATVLNCVPTLAPRASGPQVADLEFEPPIAEAAFAPGAGPLVLLDEAHHNFHTLDGRYATFGRLLQLDGFVVEPSQSRITAEALDGASLLVIANALAERNTEDWTLPTPSAFDAEEIAALRRWVETGGSLLLIADHMPFPGAAADLAAAFGLEFVNGFATDAACGADEFEFTRANGLLADHPITRGRSAAERIESVRSFTGQGFRVAEGAAAAPLLQLAPDSVILLPEASWGFSADTPRVSGAGTLQGAALLVGDGRVAAFGEAAMFSAQVSGAERRPMGMNMPSARQNPQFLLNAVRWLVGALPAE